MSEFDLYASIKRLAERERVRKNLPDFVGDSPGSIGAQSMEVPFVALRVPCLQSNHHSYMDLPGGCPTCANRGWQPQPNVAEACWEVLKHLSSNTDEISLWERDGVWYLMDGYSPIAEGGSAEEAVLRAAEAWKEKGQP